MRDSCPKCGSKDDKIDFMHEGKEIYWSDHNEIKNINKFTRNDRYYSSDKVKKECLLIACNVCKYKEAIETIKNQTKNEN